MTYIRHATDAAAVLQRGQVAVCLADAAERLGVLDDLLAELARRRGILTGADPGRQGERREETWRQDGEGTASSVRTSTGGDGESCSSDQMGAELWSRFGTRMRRSKRRGRRAGKPRVG